MGGSDFLVSQLDYLRGINCREHVLDFLCTETLQRDWERLALTHASMHRDHAVPHMENRAASEHEAHHDGGAWHAAASAESVGRLGRTGLDSASLSPEEKAFVRRCLYPWDTELHERVCRQRSEEARASTAAAARQECAVTLRFSQRKYGPCTPLETFGCVDDRTMWVSGGCRGIFNCSDAVVKCGYERTSGAQRCRCEPTPRRVAQ